MAVIKYNGIVLKKIYKGQRITLHTKGHELEGDIEIEGFDGDEAPNFSTVVVTATPTKTTQNIGPGNADFISKAVVKPIPNEYLIPKGEATFTENATYNVKELASVKVDVPQPILPAFDENYCVPKPSTITFELKLEGGKSVGDYSGMTVCSQWRVAPNPYSTVRRDAWESGSRTTFELPWDGPQRTDVDLKVWIECPGFRKSPITEFDAWFGA